MLFSAETTSKQIAVLLDPDRIEFTELESLVNKIESASVDYILLGGSLVDGHSVEEATQEIKKYTKTPVIIFPGSAYQIAESADAILFLSLISGRNPEFLIGQQVIAAPYIKRANINAISTGYMLVDCGAETTASYISGTKPLPYNKPQVAAATALAGEMLGLSTIYIDGGSGAQKAVSQELISAVRSAIDVPLIVGGGIRSKEEILSVFDAGANVVVVGTEIERNPNFLRTIKEIKESL